MSSGGAASPFGVDIVAGESMASEPDVVTTDDVLGFAGVAPPGRRPVSFCNQAALWQPP